MHSECILNIREGQNQVKVTQGHQVHITAGQNQVRMSKRSNAANTNYQMHKDSIIPKGSYYYINFLYNLIVILWS